MLVLEKRTCPSDKMPPKQVKIKNRFLILCPILFCFLILTFLGAILSQRQVCIFETSIKFSIFLIPNMTYFKEKHFHLSEEPFFKFFDRKTKNKKK